MIYLEVYLKSLLIPPSFEFYSLETFQLGSLLAIHQSDSSHHYGGNSRSCWCNQNPCVWKLIKEIYQSIYYSFVIKYTHDHGLTYSKSTHCWGIDRFRITKIVRARGMSLPISRCNSLPCIVRTIQTKVMQSKG